MKLMQRCLDWLPGRANSGRDACLSQASDAAGLECRIPCRERRTHALSQWR